jgi:hypothetical protein
MKKNLLLSIIIFSITFSIHAQNGFGVGVGMSTSKAPMVEVKYFVNKNAGSIGFSYQFFNNALGPRHDVSGTQGTDEGDYFYSIDVGYTRILNDQFSVSGEISFAKKMFYYNWSDNNYSSGGYHQIYKTKSVVGAGVFLIYNLTENFGIFAGYNSIREGTLGVQLRFIK